MRKKFFTVKMVRQRHRLPIGAVVPQPWRWWRAALPMAGDWGWVGVRSSPTKAIL